MLVEQRKETKMQAITTKYLGPTNVRGSRVKATCHAKSIILTWDDALNASDNHTKAAQTLAEQMGWDGQWYGGGCPDGKTDAFVLVNDYQAFTISKQIKAA
jgi:hypothetical protein